MAAKCSGDLPARVFGWGLLTLVFSTLLGAFSTTLNGLQTLNGLFCFDTVQAESRVEERVVSSFTISGYGHNHYYLGSDACANITAFITGDPYPFCIKWSRTEIGGFTSEGFSCSESTNGKGVIKSYSYTLDVNCTSGQTLFQSFMISLTPGSSSMTGAASVPGYYTIAVVNVNRCALSQFFYVIFSSICAAITATIFMIRAWMRTCLVGLSFKLSNSDTFYWVYNALESRGFFNFSNPYRNEPYHLVKGEKFYVMRDQSSGISEEDHDTDLESGSRSAGVLDSLAWSSANSVYKFTYDEGKVYAYSKDRSGFETFMEANVRSSVASVIREYLKWKSQSVCVTNDAKSHFLSLAECSNLAKVGYKLVEETSDDNYRMYYGSPQPESYPSDQSRELLSRKDT